jgi:ABC-type oligopeptide transport system ATPase subunit
MSTLKVEEVSQLFRSTSRGGGLTAALRKVSFDIAQGEVVTLIGESGSGKSTLGRVILRLLKPTSGKVTFGGTDIATYRERGLRDYYRQVQGVFQDPFSSYNPIYPADRVFALIRGTYFPHLAGAQWDAKLEGARRGFAEPRRRPRQVPASALGRAAAADSHRPRTAARHPAAGR